jgi:hypothetical protein
MSIIINSIQFLPAVSKSITSSVWMLAFSLFGGFVWKLASDAEKRKRDELSKVKREEEREKLAMTQELLKRARMQENRERMERGEITEAELLHGNDGNEFDLVMF